MELIITGIIAFASTNIDDLFILMLFFSNAAYGTKDVVIGQYLGVGLLIVISIIGSLAGLLVDARCIGLLGLVPIYLGIRALIGQFEKTTGVVSMKTKIGPKRNSVLTVASVTFANGGDNIGIYVPLFATMTLSEKLVMVSLFLVMIAGWCAAGKYLSRHPAIARTIDRNGHLVTPIVLIILGLYILFESGSFGLIG